MIVFNFYNIYNKIYKMIITLYSKIILYDDEYVKVVCLRPNPSELLKNDTLTITQIEKLHYLKTITTRFNQKKLSIFDFDSANNPLKCMSTNCDLIFTSNSLSNICSNINRIPLSYNYIPDLLSELTLKGFMINNDIAKISKYLGFYTTNKNVNMSNNTNLICTLQF